MGGGCYSKAVRGRAGKSGRGEELRISPERGSPERGHPPLLPKQVQGVARLFPPSLMNNLAWVHGMKDVYMPSCFTGTFGKYDLGAIHKRLAEF